MGGLVWPFFARASQVAEIPSSKGILVYKEDTSKVPMMAVLGIWSLMASSFLKKSGVSWMYDGACGTRGLMK
jgi:hypothetical protein